MARGDPCKWCGKVVNAEGLQCLGCLSRLRRAKNPEKVAAYAAAWAAKNKEKVAARAAAWSAKNKEKRAAQDAVRYAKNPEKAAARAAAWRAKNPEKVAALHADWWRAKSVGVTMTQYRKALADPNYHPDDDESEKESQ
jgi:hypothetical protein